MNPVRAQTYRELSREGAQKKNRSLFVRIGAALSGKNNALSVGGAPLCLSEHSVEVDALCAVCAIGHTGPNVLKGLIRRVDFLIVAQVRVNSPTRQWLVRVTKIRLPETFDNGVGVEGQRVVREVAVNVFNRLFRSRSQQTSPLSTIGRQHRLKKLDGCGGTVPTQKSFAGAIGGTNQNDSNQHKCAVANRA